MKINDSKNILFVVVLAVVFVATQFVSNNSGTSFMAGNGGVNLKQLNEKQKAEAKSDTISSTHILLQANQKNNVTLEQAAVISNLNYWYGNFYLGGGAVAVVSTEFGVVAPVTFVNGGINFGSSKLECKAGKFNRNGLAACNFDPQYDNMTTIMGKSANVGNAVQLSYINGNTVVGVGHYDGSQWYDLQNGTWYVCAESPIAKGLALGGGVNFGDVVSGYASAKMCIEGNTITINGNCLGTDNQNLIVAHTCGISPKLALTSSYYLKKNEQGVHFNLGIAQKFGTLFAETGTKFVQNGLVPYFGIGTSLMF